jgi:MFS transporter, ACS family, glucarate transporter
VLEQEFPLERRARASAALLTASYVGGFVAGPIATAIALAYNWRSTFLVFGGCGILFAAVCFTAMNRMALPQQRNGSTPSLKRLTASLRNSRVIALALLYLTFSGVQSFVYILLPVYLASERGTSMAALGWLASAPLFVLWIAVAASGYLSDGILHHTRSLFLARVPTGVAAMLGSSFCFATGIAAPSLSTMVVLTCLGMALVGLGQVIFWSMVQDASARDAGEVTAVVQVFGAIGVAVTPVLAAHLVQTFGGWLAVAYLLAAAGTAAAAMFWLAGRRMAADSLPSPSH